MSQKELIIQTTTEGREIALLQDKKLMELHFEDAPSGGDAYAVGDIFLGKVRKIMPGLNACFIDIGFEKEGFLHYHDLGPDIPSCLQFTRDLLVGLPVSTRLVGIQFKEPILKSGKVEDLFEGGQNVLCQIAKEPISTKGHRLTSQLSIPGRYLILIPFSNFVSLSKKIDGKGERDRLKKIINEVRPKNFGLIVRTNASEASEKELQNDMDSLLGKWDDLCSNLKQGKSKLYSEAQKSLSMTRDIVNESFERIYVDDQSLYNELKSYLSYISDDHNKEILKLYKGDKSLFESLEIDKQIKSLFNKIVNIGGGSYLIIEHTEAMHVVDVNSGSKRIKSEDQEATALRTNMDAAAEIARQIRLRDLGGLIVIDFIDMRNPANKKQLFEHLREVMTEDRARHTILPLSKFGLIQITRQRVREEIQSHETETCPVCDGTGKVNGGFNVDQEIENRLNTYINQHKEGKIVLRLHPFLAAFFTKGLPSKRVKWMIKYKRNIQVISEPTFTLQHYEIGKVGEKYVGEN